MICYNDGINTVIMILNTIIILTLRQSFINYNNDTDTIITI